MNSLDLNVFIIKSLKAMVL